MVQKSQKWPKTQIKGDPALSGVAWPWEVSLCRPQNEVVMRICARKRGRVAGEADSAEPWKKRLSML